MSKVYLVLRHSQGYYEGEYSITIDGIFSSKEKAEAATRCFTANRHEMDIYEVEIDSTETIYVY
jgi:hypothetical protein